MATPIRFNEVNCTFAETQPQYTTLPTVIELDGCVTSCWQLTRWERIKLLFTGKIWLQQLAYGHALQPQRLLVDKPAFTMSENKDGPS